MLRVNAAWIEPGYDPWEVATELASELKIMAEWLGLEAVEILPRGDLHRLSPQHEDPPAARVRATFRAGLR